MGVWSKKQSVSGDFELFWESRKISVWYFGS